MYITYTQIAQFKCLNQNYSLSHYFYKLNASVCECVAIDKRLKTPTTSKSSHYLG